MFHGEGKGVNLQVELRLLVDLPSNRASVLHYSGGSNIITRVLTLEEGGRRQGTWKDGSGRKTACPCLALKMKERAKECGGLQKVEKSRKQSLP